MPYVVSKSQFAKHVEDALSTIPPQFATFLDHVPLEIRDRPTKKQLRELGMTENDLLLGLYVGPSLADRSVDHGVELPNVIFLFQEDIEEVSESAEDLEREIRVTVLHEIGHHFGLDEDALDALGYG
ncbi:MAG TPA: metallopeptidase family protein [Tepidisphaeraceae bacterium]|jgi:predicted Zn-dependent protease with MMP-like domain